MMYSKASLFVATATLLGYPGGASCSQIRGDLNKEASLQSETSEGWTLSRNLGWLSDVLSMASKKDPKPPKTPKPTKPPTTSSPTKTPTAQVADTSSPTRQPTGAPTRQVPNICLQNPQDVYRTCIQRSSDPRYDLAEDVILRDRYN